MASGVVDRIMRMEDRVALIDTRQVLAPRGPYKNAKRSKIQTETLPAGTVVRNREDLSASTARSYASILAGSGDGNAPALGRAIWPCSSFQALPLQAHEPTHIERHDKRAVYDPLQPRRN
jgi:hypothetical protein